MNLKAPTTLLHKAPVSKLDEGHGVPIKRQNPDKDTDTRPTKRFKLQHGASLADANKSHSVPPASREVQQDRYEFLDVYAE